MTYDNLQPVDIERILQREAEKSIGDICREMGVGVMKSWVVEGHVQAREEFIPSDDMTKYLQTYVRDKYRDFITDRSSHY